MYETEICSPPVSTEERILHIPGGDPKDIFFTYQFKIQKSGSNEDVSFTLNLNPALCMTKLDSSPPAEPENISYKFRDNKLCAFSHETEEGYYIRGNIKIIRFNEPVGQFDNNTKNFLFNIETGHIANTPHSIEGLFKLIDPALENSKI